MAHLVDIRSVMDAPADVAARLASGAALLNRALAGTARDGDDPLTFVLTWSLRMAPRQDAAPAGEPTSSPGEVGPVATASAGGVRRLSDLGDNVYAIGRTLTAIVRDSWEYEERAAWVWLFLERPSALGGLSPIEALQVGRGDAVVVLLDQICDAAIARVKALSESISPAEAPRNGGANHVPPASPHASGFGV